MPPNVSFGPSPAEPPQPVPSRARKRPKRRFVAAIAMVILMAAAFAVGGRVTVTNDTSAVAADQIQSAVLPMADDVAAELDAGTSCHPAYVDCVPLDLAEDLDCEDLAITDIRLEDVGWDPYGLDGNGDGIGCESG